MKGKAFLLALLAGVAVAFGQSESGSTYQPYTPAVPAPSVGVYGGYAYGGNRASTAPQASMMGMADIISAQGNYNLSTSAAAVNASQARQQEIYNRGLATDTYFQMREANRQYRESIAKPRPTVEQITRIAQQGVPKPLTSGDVDQITGKINWPGPLAADSLMPHRKTVDELSSQWAQFGTLGYADQQKARQAINAMADELKAQIGSIPPQDYTNAKEFLKSVMYVVTGSSLS